MECAFMSVNTISGIVSVSSGTSTVWNQTTKVIPQGVYCYETDTRLAKISDGVTLYTSLPYHIGAIAGLNIGNGLQSSSGSIVAKAANSTITVTSGGIAVNSTAVSYPESDHGTVSSGTVTLDRSAAREHHLQVAGALSLALANWAPSGNYQDMILKLDNGGLATVTFPTIQWTKKDTTGDTTTIFSQTNVTLHTAATDWLLFWTRDGGATVFGTVLR
jgi:hypothetical protein